MGNLSERACKVTMFQFQNLGSYREQRLISRAEMARKTGLSPLTINKLEDGRACRPDTAKKILECLDIVLNGSSFVYDEKKNDMVVYTSPFVRSSNKQLILKRVIDGAVPEPEAPPRKAPAAKPTSPPKPAGRPKVATKPASRPGPAKTMGRPKKAKH